MATDEEKKINLARLKTYNTQLNSNVVTPMKNSIKTNSKNIENIDNKINTTKTSLNGEEITTNNNTVGYFDNLKIEGNTQYKWADGSYSDEWAKCGKNLLINTAATTTTNGLTFTVNDNKSVSVSGTATSTTTFELSTSVRDLPEGNYYISGCPTGGKSSTYALALQLRNGSVEGTVTETGKGYNLTINSTVYLKYVAIQIKNGVTIDTTFYPMITKADETNQTYEPYKEIIGLESVGEKEKNSDRKYPIDIYSMGSYNLIDVTTPMTNNDCTFVSLNWNSMLIKSKSGKYSNVVFDLPKLEVGKKYNISMYVKCVDDINAVFIINDETSRPIRKDVKGGGYVDLDFDVTASPNKIKFYSANGIPGTTFAFYNVWIVEKKDKANIDKRTILLNEPLRGIGDIKDYIDFNSNKIIRKCGIRSYQSGDESNSSIMTDKTNTIYPLTTSTTEDINITPSNSSIISYKDSCTLTTTNTLKGNIITDNIVGIENTIEKYQSELNNANTRIQNLEDNLNSLTTTITTYMASN